MKSLLFIPVIVLLVYSVCAQEVIDQTTDSELMYLAQNAYNDELYDVAEIQLKTLTERFPASSLINDARLLLGKTQFQLHKYDEAEQNFFALFQDTGNPYREEGLFFLIENCRQKTAYRKAVDYFSILKNQYPESRFMASAQYSAGVSYYYLREFDTALDHFEDVIRLYPSAEAALSVRYFLGRTYFELQEYPKAAEVLQAVLESNPDVSFRSDALFWIGESYFYNKNYTEAVTYFERVAGLEEEHEWDDEALFHLGIAKIEIGDLETAAELLMQWREKFPTSSLVALVSVQLAYVFYQLGEYEQCVETITPMLGTSLPEDQKGLAWFLYSKSHVELRNIGLAEEGFNKILSFVPDRAMLAEVYFGLGACKYLQDSFEESILYFRQSMLQAEDDILDTKCHLSIADAFFALERYNDAVDELNKAMANDNGKREFGGRIHYMLGRCAFAQENYTEALEFFKKAGDLFPGSDYADDALFSIGWTLFATGDYTEAVQSFSEYIDRYKDNDMCAYALMYRGQALYALNDYNGAIQSYEMVAKLHHDSPLADKGVYETAWSYYQQGEAEQAVSHFNTLVTDYPKSVYAPDVYFWLGEYSYNNGDFAQAHSYFSRLVSDYADVPLYAKALFWAGRSAYLAQKYDEAEQLLGRFIEKFPDSDLIADARLTRAETMVARNEYDPALKILNELVDRHPNTYLMDEVYLLMGKIQFLQKDYFKAIEAYQKVTKSFDRELSAQAWYYIGKSYMERQEGSRAIEALLRVVYQYPDQRKWFYQACFDAGVYYDDRKKSRQAKKIFTKMLTAYPDSDVYPGLLDDARQRLNNLK
ncbi:MAG: tetratricopeptide repeat protein [Candidatus Auribacterota bacterium]